MPTTSDLAKLDPVHANAIVIAEALLDYQSAPGERQKTLEPALAREACIVLAAALLETSVDDALPKHAKAMAAKMVDHGAVPP